MAVFVPGMHIGKKASTFVWIYIMSVRWRRDSAILKNTQKIVLPANENLTTIFNKHVYES